MKPDLIQRLFCSSLNLIGLSTFIKSGDMGNLATLRLNTKRNTDRKEIH